MLSKPWIDFEFKKQNYNTIKIYLKFWAAHESRNQMKVWDKKVVTTTFERAIENVFKSCAENTRWVPNLETFIKKYFNLLYSELSKLTDENNLVIPNPILSFLAKDEKVKLTSELNLVENFLNKLTKKINKKKSKLLKTEKRNSFYSNHNFFSFLKKWNVKKISKLKNKIDEYNNLNITTKKQQSELENKIKTIEQKIFYYSNNETLYKDQILGCEENGLIFIPLQTFMLNLEKYKNKKGVYILKNLDKNKYYVGQTKNFYKRLGLEHFDIKTNLCKNNNFAYDYNVEKNKFEIAILHCETKDKLDEMEKFYINLFDSFYNGYNKTSGNI